jgi:hypothetical protein
MTRSVYFLDPDGLMMELYANTFDSEEEGLAFMKATPGQSVPIDITAAEPARPSIPAGDYSKGD